MRIVTVIPRFIGGGPERHLLALAAEWRAAGLRFAQEVLVLEGPLSARLLVRARSLGIGVRLARGPDDIASATETADVLEIVYWQHPVLLEALAEDLGTAPRLFRIAVTGNTPPQSLASTIGSADAIVVVTPATLAIEPVATVARTGGIVTCVPALADMSRLRGLVRRPHEGIRVGYLGLVEPVKMHPAFADLCAAVSDPRVRFDVYGDGEWGAFLEERCRDLGIAERVVVHGHTEDVAEVLAEFDVFGYPLAAETSASSDKTLQEAMWVGVPPVLIAGSGVAAYVDHEETGLVCASVDGYPAAIDRIVGDSRLRARLGRNARAYAREVFDPTRNAWRLWEVFAATCAAPRRTRRTLAGPPVASGAARFITVLGEIANPYEISLAGSAEHSDAEIAAAEAEIARMSRVVAQGEGGLHHYASTYPEDPHLRLWAGLWERGQGREAIADRLFDEAMHLGMAPHRLGNGE